MDLKDKFEDLIHHAHEYVNAQIDLLKLRAVEKISRIIAFIVGLFFIVLMFTLAFLFVSIALAHYFGELWGHAWAGYLTVTGIYLLLGIILLKFRESLIVKPLMNLMVRIIFSNEHNEKKNGKSSGYERTGK